MKELNQQIHDLVRFMRTELHQEGLITDEEYVALAGDNSATQRLEDYDRVVQRAKEAAASKRPSGLVHALISEIIQLNCELVDWKREFLMYRNAWMREIGGITVHKSHEIDAFVLSTRAALARGATKEIAQP
jgi:hypothetical protein